MKLYYGRDVRGIYKASLNYDTIRRYSFDGNISSGDVPVIHNGKVYLIKTLYGDVCSEKHFLIQLNLIREMENYMLTYPE